MLDLKATALPVRVPILRGRHHIGRHQNVISGAIYIATNIETTIQVVATDTLLPYFTFSLLEDIKVGAVFRTGVEFAFAGARFNEPDGVDAVPFGCFFDPIVNFWNAPFRQLSFELRDSANPRITFCLAPCLAQKWGCFGLGLYPIYKCR